MNTFYTSDRATWRAWLEANFETEMEIWFIFPMKAAEEASLSYNDAVEEALCFGWIDSTIKHIDPLYRAQRFTPRKSGVAYSRPNIERLLWLEERNLIHPKVREVVLPSFKHLMCSQRIFWMPFEPTIRYGELHPPPGSLPADSDSLH